MPVSSSGTARSRLPSLFRSSTAKALGLPIGPKSVGPVKNSPASRSGAKRRLPLASWVMTAVLRAKCSRSSPSSVQPAPKALARSLLTSTWPLWMAETAEASKLLVTSSL